jgi:thioredoxin reductase
VVVIGAGPYGLAAAAHLRGRGVETRVFGETMEFWATQMPEGMIVRSVWEASHISAPEGALTMDEYVATERVTIKPPTPLSDFINYGRWFQKRVVPDLDSRRVARVELGPHAFRVVLADEEVIHAQRVVVATGIAKFARRPALYEGLPQELVSHTSDHRRLEHFRGKSVIVVGGGQSALESAALLHEVGADVELIARQPQIHFLDQTVPWLKSDSNPVRRLFYPPSDVGPPGLNWIVATPGLFKRFPRAMQEAIAYRSIRPAGSGWLVPRLREVPLRTNLRVVAISDDGQGKVSLKLDDESTRRVDHVMLATGYQVDVTRHNFLAPELVRALHVVDGYPELGPGMESSIRGLHFMGAPAARSFGPINRFVSGTTFSAPALACHITASSRSGSRWRED